jgi:hypothetical protein
MRYINDEVLEKYKKSLQDNYRTFVIKEKRKDAKLYIRDKLVIIKRKKVKKDENHSKIISFFGQVKKNINNFLKKCDNNFEFVRQRHGATYTNKEKWNKMKVGDVFYYVDVSHCFWRIAYIKTYIGERLYVNTLAKPEYKNYRNKSLALIVAPETTYNYVNGQLKSIEQEDTSLYRKLYNNIRFTCYNLLGDAKDNFYTHTIGYRIDGIMVTRPALKNVQEYFIESGYQITVKKCVKADDFTYMIDNEFKKV